MIDIALSKRLESAAGSMLLEVSCTIERGSFVTLFGASGAGKTTLLRLLAGLSEPDSGRIVVDGRTWFDSSARITLPPQQRAIGFVFQDYALFPNLNVRENIAYAVDKHERAWVDALLEMTKLSELQHRAPATLSGGQRQRVALARALARKPALLLLDEPLSALDSGLRTQLQDDLASLHKRFGLTTLLVSHDMGEVFRLCDRVLCLEGGRITRSGTPADVFLRQGVTGKLNLRAQVLAVRQEEVVHIVSLLVGQDIVEVVASAEEVAELQVGAFVLISPKAASALLFGARE